jgi:hypothetical protein
MRSEAPPGLGQPDGATDPLEERHPDLVLQTGDLPAHRRLVTLERIGRTPQML